MPYGEHAGAYNVPTINEVAVMAGEPCERRDIHIQRRNNTMGIIQDNQRSYDALQYPLIFLGMRRWISYRTTYRLSYNYFFLNP